MFKIDKATLGPAVGLLGLFAMAILGSIHTQQFEKPNGHNQTEPSKSESQRGDTAVLGPTPINNEQANERKDEDHWWNTFTEDSTDWLLVIFTGLLVIVTNRLVNSTNKLWDAGEKQIKAAGRMERIAGQQVAIQGLQSDIQIKQQAIERLQLIATHRPCVEVRFVRKLAEDPNRSADAQPIRVEFGIVNTGTATGTITGSSVILDYFVRDEWPNPNELGDDKGIITHRIMGAGNTDRFTVQTNEHGGLNATSRDKRLYLIGWIVYVDEGGNPRTTHFCREYSEERRRFERVDDPDYESTY